MGTATLYRVLLRSNSYTVHAFEAQAPTAAFKAASVHKHSEVRLVAHVELGISCIKQVNWLIRLEKHLKRQKARPEPTEHSGMLFAKFASTL
jgi:hypothetical protein